MGAVTVGRILGVAVAVHPLLLVLLALAAAMGLLGQILVLLAVLVTHELAHLTAARVCGLEVARVELLPYGGVADVRGAGRDPLVEAVVALAGPLNNLILLAASVALERAGWLAGPWVPPFQQANLAMALFNLLPALPLDGGRILLAFLRRARGPRQATAVVARIGRAVAAGMVATALLAWWWQVLAPHLLAAAATIWAGTGREERWVGVAALRGLWAKRGRLRRAGLLPVSRLVVLEHASLRQVAEAMRPGSYHEIVVLGTDHRPLAELDEGHLLRGILALGLDARVAELLELGE